METDNTLSQTDFVVSLRVIAQEAKLPEERDTAPRYNRHVLEILERLDTMETLPSTFQAWVSEIELDLQKLSGE